MSNPHPEPAGSVRPPTGILLLVVFFTAAVVMTVVGFGIHDWQPPSGSVHGAGTDFVIQYLLVATGILIVLGHVVLIWFLWVNQGGGASQYRPVATRTEWLAALPAVLVMSIIAEAGVFLFALPVWGQLYGPTPDNAVRVEVVGKQFEWIIRYAGKDGKFGKVDPKLVDDSENPLGLDENDPSATDDIVTRGRLVLPSDTPIAISLRSLDVLHSFTVPQLRVKQDAIPGFTAKVQFVPNVVGKYEIACVELCGLGHYRMRGFTEIKKPDDFKKWLGDQTGMFEDE